MDTRTAVSAVCTLVLLWIMGVTTYFVVNKVRYDRRVALGTERIAFQLEEISAKTWPATPVGVSANP